MDELFLLSVAAASVGGAPCELEGVTKFCGDVREPGFFFAREAAATQTSGCCYQPSPPPPHTHHLHTRASFPSSSNIIGVCTGKKTEHAQHHMDSPTPSSVATDRKCVAFLAPGGFKMPRRFILGGLFMEFRKIRLHCTRQAKNATYVFFPVSLFSIADLLLKNIPRIQYHLRKKQRDVSNFQQQLLTYTTIPDLCNR